MHHTRYETFDDRIAIHFRLLELNKGSISFRALQFQGDIILEYNAH
jgi:hypothetical protein